jgi:predicted Rossmann fold nucleotide-binding protein DprA/Smf involved in DNA uptake
VPLVDFEFFFGEAAPLKGISPDISEAGAADGAKNRLDNMSEAEKILVALLTNQGDRTIDNLAGEAKMSAAEVFKAISMLSLRGVIFSSGSGRYSLAD